MPGHAAFNLPVSIAGSFLPDSAFEIEKSHLAKNVRTVFDVAQRRFHKTNIERPGG